MMKKISIAELNSQLLEKRLKIRTKPLMITALSSKDRKAVEERLKILSALMREVEIYLRGYVAGSENVGTFLNTMSWVHEDIEETAKELMKLHDLPDFFQAVQREAQARREARTKRS